MSFDLVTGEIMIPAHSGGTKCCKRIDTWFADDRIDRKWWFFGVFVFLDSDK